MKKLLLLLTIGFVAINTSAQVNVGDLAPEFKLLNTDNSMVALSDYDDKEGVILIFTCNHCPYAKFYEERINALHKKYAPKGFPVVAINPNDSVQYKTDGFSYMVQKNYTFPYLLDNIGVYKTYGATKTPHVFLLNKTKAGIKVAYVGAIDDSPQDASLVKIKYLEDAIAAIKKGENASPSVTKAIGCSIKPFN